MVLKKIVESKKVWLDRVWSKRTFDGIDSLALSERSFKDALKKESTGFILECKKASPSKGLIRPDFDIMEIALAYAPFADAVSVLADEEYFSGSYDYIETVSQNVDVPVLCKDFILEPFQIKLARSKGADAVLLMMSILDDARFTTCFDAAHKLNMDALVEVRNEDELKRALALGAEIIGINNRNLDNLEIDMDTTKRLAPLVPKDKVVISESGFNNNEQISLFAEIVDGFLVGSSIMQKENITMAAGELIYGKIKVCGIANRDDAVNIANRGVYYGGLIFAEGSPRKISLKKAALIIENVKLNFVGIFRDTTIEDIVYAVKELNLKVVQLHGSESPEFVLQLKQLLPEDTKIWKAFSVTDTLPDTSQYKNCTVLYDSKQGGSGTSFNWNLLKHINMSESVIAGGIGPENILQAKKLNPGVIDLNSKIEKSAGVKDMTKLHAALSELRGKGRTL
ncbi:MAG: bifunctional indole-3-glycerol-phosphate synthase TrpC/phosphoribosylanthranilate isomerase TrpF [Deltaproteobacteria bacterium]|nr:bifunctional indole-3-glycerol-phosphate synthase TrpC/phosphoribosylanthranilate isomerase TrpF [Deltaproteobacteria bacterium]